MPSLLKTKPGLGCTPASPSPEQYLFTLLISVWSSPINSLFRSQGTLNLVAGKRSVLRESTPAAPKQSETGKGNQKGVLMSYRAIVYGSGVRILQAQVFGTSVTQHCLFVAKYLLEIASKQHNVSFWRPTGGEGKWSIIMETPWVSQPSSSEKQEQEDKQQLYLHVKLKADNRNGNLAQI